MWSMKVIYKLGRKRDLLKLLISSATEDGSLLREIFKTYKKHTNQCYKTLNK